MSFVTWKDTMSVNVKEIDDQHKKLISLINELHGWIQAGEKKDFLGDVLEELINYTRYHFSAEERRMKEFSYIGYVEHKREHDDFTDKILSLKEKYDKGEKALSSEVSSFLKDWLTNHILGTDKKYTPFFNSKGIL
jgi:hemerythrin-like metal-binding protein